jgi:putative ABC transport system substrate-binding protein
VNERADVIVTVVTATAIAARRATNVLPIVMYISGYPVEGGLADSLAKPGGNVTGMTLYAGGGVLFGKFVQLLRELRPSLRELGVFWGYAPPSYRLAQVAPATEELRQAARALNINVHFWQTGTDSDVSAALSAAASAPLDAMFVTAGVINGLPETPNRIVRFIQERRLPTLPTFLQVSSSPAAQFSRTPRRSRNSPLEPRTSWRAFLRAHGPVTSRSNNPPSTNSSST